MLCPYCKSPIVAGDVFCSECGAPLPAAAAPTGNAVAARRPSKKVIIAAACAAVAVIILVIVLLVKSSAPEPWTENDMFFYSKSSSEPITGWEEGPWGEMYNASLSDCADDYFDARTFRGVRIGDDAVSALKKYPLEGHAAIVTDSYDEGMDIQPYSSHSDAQKIIERAAQNDTHIGIALGFFIYDSGSMECLSYDQIRAIEASGENPLDTYSSRNTIYVVQILIENGQIKDIFIGGGRRPGLTAAP